MHIDVQRFYKQFFEEAFEGIETMEAGLLAMHSSNDPEIINDVFRAAHSIKGMLAISSRVQLLPTPFVRAKPS